MASITTAATLFLVAKLEQRPWGTRDFYVKDPDGYILCFAEAV